MAAASDASDSEGDGNDENMEEEEDEVWTLPPTRTNYAGYALKADFVFRK